MMIMPIATLLLCLIAWAAVAGPAPARAADSLPKPAIAGCAPDRLPRTNLLVCHTAKGVIAPVRSRGDWQNRRAEILRGLQAVMGPMPGKAKRCPLDLRLEKEIDDGPCLRRFITYASEPG